MRFKQAFSDSAIGSGFYSRQGIDVDAVMETNNLLIGHKYGKEISVIGHKPDKEIYLIERYVVNELRKGIISSLRVHAGARLDVW
jgi:hypothetical protein